MADKQTELSFKVIMHNACSNNRIKISGHIHMVSDISATLSISKMFCDLFHLILISPYEGLNKIVIIITVISTSMGQYLTNKGEHTMLYKINRNVYIKPQN